VNVNIQKHKSNSELTIGSCYFILFGNLTCQLEHLKRVLHAVNIYSLNSYLTVNTQCQLGNSTIRICGPGSVFGIATGYELDGPGIESRWRRDFLHLSTPALGPTMGNGFSPGVKSGRSVTLTPHPLLVPLVMKE